MGDMERGLLKVFCDQIAAAFDNLHTFELLTTTQEATVAALADLAESHDSANAGHVSRVGAITFGIAAELKAANLFAGDLTPDFMSLVGVASILHDVGKVTTPDAVLLKPARHTPEERAIMQAHASAGEMVLARAAKQVEGVSALSIGAQIAGGHHEHFDGNGYPRGLKGTATPLAARIVALVDVFDALLNDRVYDKAWPMEQVMAHIAERRGSQFDPDVVDAFMRYWAKTAPV
jgi:response regulator RpfG family c-di-GMP phosphodiesterase